MSWRNNSRLVTIKLCIYRNELALAQDPIWFLFLIYLLIIYKTKTISKFTIESSKTSNIEDVMNQRKEQISLLQKGGEEQVHFWKLKQVPETSSF